MEDQLFDSSPEYDENQLLKDNIVITDLAEAGIIDFQALIRGYELTEVADELLEGTYAESDFMKKDTVDRFIDFIHNKCITGYIEIPSLAYPTKRMIDRELEEKVIVLMNDLLYPEIVLKLLKFFTRNLHDADSNLYIANLITSKDIIRSLFDTFKLFRSDIFIRDREKRCRNVKMMQQFSPRSDTRLSSPLDAAARLKYILEYLQLTRDVRDVYQPEDITMFT